MITAVSLTTLALAVFATDLDAEFLARVEKTELRDSKGKPVPRVQRNADGNIEKLRLGGMSLSGDDFAAIARIRSLRNLDLHKTNLTDADLRMLGGLPRLKGLNLSSTAITDAAVDGLMTLESLQSLCLGDVAVTPGGVERLKQHFRNHNRRLSLGYYQRKENRSNGQTRAN